MAGNVRYVSEEIKEDAETTSHCDRFWALAFGNYAKSTKRVVSYDNKFDGVKRDHTRFII